MKRQVTTIPIAVLIAFWVIQIVRITHGIDFNDEMQYYGELVGLVSSGRLFSTDLFIQQGANLLIYPIFKPYVAVFGWSHLIFAARCVFSLFVFWVYRRVRRSLASADVPSAAASVAAFACTFAVPFMNIYAISYNSVGIGLLAVAFGEFYAWRCRDQRVRIGWWTAILIGLGAAHPPLAIAVALVLVARLWFDGDIVAMKRLGVAVCASAVVVAIVIYPLTTVADLRLAIEFSRAMSVGTVFRTGLPWLIGVLGGVVALFTLTQRRVPQIVADAEIRLGFLMPVAMAAICIGAGLLESASFAWAAALVCVSGGLALTSWPEPEQSERRRWTTFLFLGSGIAVSFASSNGFRQIQGPALIAAPFFFCMAASPAIRPRALKSRKACGWTFGMGLIAVLVIFTLANPYHDGRLLQQTTRMDDAPAFRGLFITPAKADAIREIRRVLSDIPSGSRLMVLGTQPWIYFATNTYPDTDMVFMHLYGLPRAYEIVAERLRLRRPDYVIITGDVPAPVRKAFDELVREGSFTCESRPIGPALERAPEELQLFYAFSPQLSVCRRVANSTPAA